METTEALARPVNYGQATPNYRKVLKMPRWINMFLRRYGVTLLALAILWGDTTVTAAIVRHNTTIDVTEKLTAQYEAEYADKLESYKQQQQAANLITGEASLMAAMDQEADDIARVIGTMATKRMKLTMMWNILVRVDSPFYPNNVSEVVAQPQQWMFFDEKNPIREDDKQLVLEQLKLWHEGRYPAGLSAAYVYGEWSTNDYVLRDSWEKNSKTNYWRFPE